MARQTPKYKGPATKDHHDNRFGLGPGRAGTLGPKKGGAGGKNWGTELDELKEIGISVGERFEDPKLSPNVIPSEPKIRLVSEESLTSSI
jgi:hypothetical protein